MPCDAPSLTPCAQAGDARPSNDARRTPPEVCRSPGPTMSSCSDTPRPMARRAIRALSPSMEDASSCRRWLGRSPSGCSSIAITHHHVFTRCITQHVSGIDGGALPGVPDRSFNQACMASHHEPASGGWCSVVRVDPVVAFCHVVQLVATAGVTRSDTMPALCPPAAKIKVVWVWVSRWILYTGAPGRDMVAHGTHDQHRRIDVHQCHTYAANAVVSLGQRIVQKQRRQVFVVHALWQASEVGIPTHHVVAHLVFTQQIAAGVARPDQVTGVQKLERARPLGDP